VIIVTFLFYTLAFSEVKPITDVEINTYFSNSNNFIPLKEGTNLKKNLNFLMRENGEISISNIFMYYQLEQELNNEYIKQSINKFFFEYKLNNMIISFGKRTKNIGISRNSLILSENAKPFPMIYIENTKPVKWHGEWRFLILKGWIDEKRKDTSNPELIILRTEYSPSEVINFGLNRFSMYGGEGLNGFKIWEYPKMLIGSEENIPGSKYDTDGYFGYDISLNLKKYIKKFDSFKLYYQQIGTDIQAFWQKEDRGKIYFPWIVKLTLNSYQGGIEIKDKNSKYNLEFTSVNDLFYIHHYYRIEGYTYHGFSLGYPYGRYLQSIQFQQKISKNGLDIFKYSTGWFKQPSSYKPRENIKEKINKYYLESEYTFPLRKNINLSFYSRFEYSNNYDRDQNPMQFDISNSNKLFVIAGITTKITF